MHFSLSLQCKTGTARVQNRDIVGRYLSRVFSVVIMYSMPGTSESAVMEPLSQQ